MDTHFQVFTHLLSDNTKADTREVIDSEMSILGVIRYEDSATAPLHLVILEQLCKILQAYYVHHLVKHDLDEDTATRRGIIFHSSEMNDTAKVEEVSPRLILYTFLLFH